MKIRKPHAAFAAPAAFIAASLLASPLCESPAYGATALIGPQVVIAIGNSESMDGDLSGAIMTGSGVLSSSYAYLANSSSPTSYTVPTGFTPPLAAANSAGQALYTTTSGSTQYDNSASRLNVAKAGILSVIQQYVQQMNFALEDYSTSGLTKYATWVYYMSPSGGFAFAGAPPSGFSFSLSQLQGMLPTNGFLDVDDTSGAYANVGYANYSKFVAANPTASPAPTLWVVNPCYNYTAQPSSLKNQCGQVASSGIVSSTTLANSVLMQIGASSDDPEVNDVLYGGASQAIALDYGGSAAYYAFSYYLGSINPPSSTPYTYFSLGDYENGNVSVGYNGYTNGNFWITGPTNAGYVPYSPQVMYALRGFGYGASQSATTGTSVIAMTAAPTTSSATTTLLGKWSTALAPETNSTSTSEIKASAGQSPLAGLLQGAGKQFQAVATSGGTSCGGKYVILVTDGLPTYDLNGYNWPPLGSASGQGYGVQAAFYGVAADSTYGIVDDSGNVPSGQTPGALDTSKTNDQALIDTIAAINKLSSEGVKVYVIGLGAGVDKTLNPAANYALNAMAIAGGTDAEFPATNPAAFASALSTIVGQIAAASQVTAPVSASSIGSGSLVYTATSNNQPGSIAGSVQAFQTVAAPTSSASAPLGTTTGPAVWDAGDATHMSAATRQANLYSTSSTGSIVTLQSLGTSTSANYDAAAFSLTPSTCVPNTATILAYTFDPSFNTTGDSASLTGLGFPSGVSGCSYLAGRQLNWMLGGLSANDYIAYLGPPGNAALLNASGYLAYARANASREKLVLFTSNDGFLYAVDASSGNLVWGWMPRPLVADLQNYSAFQNGQYFNGQFVATDAVDTTTSPGASNWATYIVGTAQGGAYHYAVQLTADGVTPTRQPWGVTTSGGASPQDQAPLIITAGNMQYAVFTVNTTASSTTTTKLYEVDIATGATTSATLSLGGGHVTSSLNYITSTGMLLMGDSTGKIWSINISGNASNDIAGLIDMASVSPAAALQWVGYTEYNGTPYLWAETSNQVSVLSMSGGSSSVIWSASPSSSSSTTKGITPALLQYGGVITAAAAVVNGTLVVPVSVPPVSGCGDDVAYYQFYALTSGGPPGTTITYGNVTVTTGYVRLGNGEALTPIVRVTSGSPIIYPGTSIPGSGSSGSPITPISFSGGVSNKPIGWRQY